MNILEQNIFSIISTIFKDLKNVVMSDEDLLDYDKFYLTFYLHKNCFNDITFDEKKILKELKNVIPERAHRILSVYIEFDETNSVNEKLSLLVLRENVAFFDNVDTVYFKTVEEFVSKFNVFKEQISMLDQTEVVEIHCCIPNNLSDNKNSVDAIKENLFTLNTQHFILTGLHNIGIVYLTKNFIETNTINITLSNSKNTINVNANKTIH